MCDGSGILEEFYVDVDRTNVVECHGCPACDELLAEEVAAVAANAELAEMLELVPLWAGETEAVYEVRPFSPLLHVREGVERIVREQQVVA